MPVKVRKVETIFQISTLFHLFAVEIPCLSKRLSRYDKAGGVKDFL
jgi:hypothetical protein